MRAADSESRSARGLHWIRTPIVSDKSVRAFVWPPGFGHGWDLHSPQTRKASVESKPPGIRGRCVGRGGKTSLPKRGRHRRRWGVESCGRKLRGAGIAVRGLDGQDRAVRPLGVKHAAAEQARGGPVGSAKAIGQSSITPHSNNLRPHPRPPTPSSSSVSNTLFPKISLPRSCHPIGRQASRGKSPSIGGDGRCASPHALPQPHSFPTALLSQSRQLCGLRRGRPSSWQTSPGSQESTPPGPQRLGKGKHK